ncbi:exostosin family protein [Hyphococcus sp. DH-69]|uniref:exostosin domain-containing protein n=1 Tax=Hyphococcus formosus TaxID=3143534 RepID=UPI00398B5549
MQQAPVPKIFVVTPSFNAAETIQRTLMSVATQSGNIEIYHHVSDGGSVDDTTEKLRAWQDLANSSAFPIVARNYKFSFSSENDDGMYDAITKGFDQFSINSNDWMCWINADDVFLPGAFALIGQIEVSPSAKDITWLTGTAALAADDISMLHTNRPVGSVIAKNGLCDGIHWEFIQSEGTFFRNALWRKIDPDADFRSFRFAGDWNLWRKFAQQNELYQTTHPLAVFSIRSGQLSSANRDEYESEIDSHLSLAKRQSNFDALKKAELNGKQIKVAARPSRIKIDDRTLKNHYAYREIEMAKGQSEGGHGPIIAFDDKWQFPAITEKHAYEKIREWMPKNATITYFAFPWATLIDKANNNADDAPAIENEALKLAKKISPPGRTVVTVCQHILMKDFLDIFKKCGITDIFWTHETKDGLPEKTRNGINIHPFPLYPVQVGDNEASERERDFLFSFIGAKSNQWYLTDTRLHIIDMLSDDPRGLVIGREDWHYNKIVYSHQVKSEHADPTGLIDLDHSELFKATLNRSIFSLCPSGSGPNSIRLWESIASGAIPVIMADTYLPPGNMDLWKEAAIVVEETPEAIAALPDQLAALSKDEHFIANKRKAMRQLLLLYGADTFVYDVQDCVLKHEQKVASKRYISELPLDLKNLNECGRLGFEKGDNASKRLFLRAISTRAMIDPEAFTQMLSRSETLQRYVNRAVAQDANDAHLKHVASVLKTTSIQRTNHLPDKKSRIILRGKHANRTPLSYPAYQNLFEPYIEFVDEMTEGSTLVTGFDIDFRDEKIASLAIETQSTPIIISEEPLWDTVWASAYDQDIANINANGRNIEYRALNHITSSIFAFDKIPYFITTEDHYFLRYSNLFQKNAALSTDEILDIWKNASWKAAFFAERREDDRYDFSYPESDLYGLSGYRTRIADGFDDALRCGKGWNEAGPRQALPDWHLDKLASLNRNCLIISGLENTHQHHYITEKIFDAYACLGIPLYYASENHKVHKLVSDDTFINLYGLSADEAISTIRAFEPDHAFAERYLETQKRLSKLFGDPRNLIRERIRVVNETVSELKKLQA